MKREEEKSLEEAREEKARGQKVIRENMREETRNVIKRQSDRGTRR